MKSGAREVFSFPFLSHSSLLTKAPVKVIQRPPRSFPLLSASRTATLTIATLWFWFSCTWQRRESVPPAAPRRDVFEKSRSQQPCPPSLASNSKSSFWPAAYSASWLTTLSAIFVKVASVFFSSCNVASRSPMASPRPSSLAQVFKVP
jgi:hypothetical protein